MNNSLISIATGIFAFIFAAIPAAAQISDAEAYRITKWDRGIALYPVDNPDMKMYLWFYEWNLFGAVKPEQHTRGNWENTVIVNTEGTGATISCPPHFTLKARTATGGIELTLIANNKSGRDWPDLAGIIACFNPGPENERNRQFANTDTFFLGPEGLVRLEARQIHYNASLRKAIDKRANADGEYVWSPKWPVAGPDATRGIIIRESTGRQWVTGITWDRFLSSQAHNPWECMHLGIHLGPLERGASRTIRGKIYLLKGGPRVLLKRFRQDFISG